MSSSARKKDRESGVGARESASGRTCTARAPLLWRLAKNHLPIGGGNAGRSPNGTLDSSSFFIGIKFRLIIDNY